MTTASPIPGIKVLLMGGPGSGKTHVLRTWIDAGITPFVLFTENSMDVIGDVPKEKLHWTYVNPMSTDLKTLRDAAVRVGTMNADAIQKTHDMTRNTTNKFYAILDALAGFKCQRTGQDFGNVGTWGTDRALIIDSLSGLTIAATKLAVGEKYAMTQPEFQIAMKTIENLLIQICTGFHCHAVVTAHLERELDEVNGGVKIYPSTLGRKLAPTLGRFFTDVIMAKRQGIKFVWDTADGQADLKGRNIPIGSENPPSFAPLIQRWQSRGGLISPLLPH
jgi:hypothetical protein